ncbi:MAG: leucine-rich repeat domain-containing protein, partial [Chloroflexi bacterium]|nr:leucine-rich repeat domain-containing protein [Chloroflexota bacterium]
MQRSKSTWKPQQQAIMALVLGLVLLTGVVGISTPSRPAAAQGGEPTATPTAVPSPIPTAVPTVSSDASDDEAPLVGLFSDVDGEPPPRVGVDALASRLVEIDFGQLGQAMETPAGTKDAVTGEPQPPHKLILNLFDDVVFTGIVEHVEPTASGHALWGSLEGVELGTMTLVVTGSIVVGTVRTPYAVYTIRTAGDGTYVIRQIDESSLPPSGEPLEASPSPRDPSTQSDDIPPDDGSVIDVMVVYTPLAKLREGGRAAIEALIDLFVAEANQAYANSGVIHRIKLVLREEVDYTEDGYSQLDLQRLRRAFDGYMDHVHERRDLYAADLIHIVVGKSDTGGLGGFRGESAAFGFGLTASYAGGLVFAHELGHNMGLRHDRFEAGVGVGVPQTGSNYGYVNQRMFEAGAPESARWRTIMAYPTQCWEVGDFYCPWVQYFANPEKTYRGDPMGVPADHPSTDVDGPADAVGALNDRRAITANFRRSSSSPTPRVGLNLSPYWLSERGGTSTVTATLHRPSSEDTTVTVSATPSDAVRLSRNGVLTIPAGETVSRGAVTITGVNNGTSTGDVSVTISATAANSSSLGVVAPEPVELAIADDETRPVVTLSLSPPVIPEIDGRTFVSGMLDNRSGVETIVTVFVRPSNAVHRFDFRTLTIPAGRRVSDGFGVSIYALDDDILTVAQKSVTVSGTARNSHGVTGPESVTLTIIDDEAPYFAHDSITYSFTEGVAGGRFLPEAAYGNGELTYSLSPSSGSDVTFTPGPPGHIGVPASLQAGLEVRYTLTATDADGDSDTMTIIIEVREGECPDSAAVAGYSDPKIVNDCEALLASRDALSIERTLNWDMDLPIEKWEGVEVRGSRVVGLRIVPSVGLPIVRVGIVGTIPSELGSLSSLRTLSLWGNQLTGGIPKELGSLTNLQTLDLNENRLTGEIPKELGSLAKLQWLNLFENRLTGEIPTELGDLSELIRLSLSGNRLTGEIPAELENLPVLLGLYLRDNLLTGCVPDGLRDVQHNDFAELGLPFCVDLACSTLAEASSGTNNPGLKSDCVALLAARDVLAGTATLNWSTDTPIADWSGVVLEGTPGRVTELRLRNLGLTGEIPPEFGSLSDLRHLNLSDNILTGHIPTELGGLSNLQELYLIGNGLSGCVLDELRDIPSNDFAGLALPFCSEHPCVGGGAVADATNPG